MNRLRLPVLGAAALALAGSATVALAGCAAPPSAPAADAGGTPRVVAAFYPFAFVAERVGGPDVAVQNLTRPGAEPHDLELSPRQVAALGAADLVLHLDGFQPAVDAAVEREAGGRALDVASVVRLERGDPHLWLDPTRLAAVARAVADRLAEIAPGSAAGYRRRAEDLAGDLSALDARFRTGLADCARRTFVTSHAAFGYLAERYGLDQVAVSGLSPEAEPGPARVAAVQRVVRAEGITTIFYETLVSPKVAETMAADLGVATAVLDPVEGVADPAAEDYLAVMGANLAALRAANGCS